MSNTKLQEAYGTIIDFYKDTYQREYVANKLLENVNYSITKSKENLDKKQTEWLNEYENCEHTGQSTDKLGQLERVCHQYIPQNIENLTETKTAIEKAMASLGINQKVTKTLDNHIDPRKLINQRPDPANKQKSTKVVVQTALLPEHEVKLLKLGREKTNAGIHFVPAYYFFAVICVLVARKFTWLTSLLRKQIHTWSS